MKTKILFSAILFIFSLSASSTKWTITNSGFTFSPATITITQGDSVLFTIASNHNVLEVSQTTWAANGVTPLSGGFNAPFGGGLILPAKLTPGTHFYVCELHASMGMKGQIIVNTTTGIASDTPAYSFSLYPNPTQEIINISAPAEFSGIPYVISDLQGKQLMSGTFMNGNQSLDISRFAEGIYLFRFGDLKRSSIKFVKN